jgi:septin family protein
MGPTGSGKSNVTINNLPSQLYRFSLKDSVQMIAKLTEQAGIVGHELKSCTSNIKAFRIRGHVLYQDRLVLVDTPGFDDTVKSEMDILKMIAGWLAKR